MVRSLEPVALALVREEFFTERLWEGREAEDGKCDGKETGREGGAHSDLFGERQLEVSHHDDWKNHDCDISDDIEGADCVPKCKLVEAFSSLVSPRMG